MALGRTRFFALGLIFEDFSTRGMKKFPYLKTGPFGNPIFIQSYWGYFLEFRIEIKIESNTVIFRIYRSKTLFYDYMYMIAGQIKMS